MEQKIIILSGGFAPVHVGHLRMFKAAKEDYGATVVVGVNSDEWLCRKKGQPFMPLTERLEIIKGFKYVDYVYSFDDDDETACDLIRKITQMYGEFQGSDTHIYFGNGGDRTTDTTPEMDYCEERGVELIWNVGGGKVQSSSDLIRDAKVL